MNVTAALPGDTNLDQRVNFDDLLALAKHYNAVSRATWSSGDLTGDGAVTFDDLLSLAKNYNKGGAPLLADFS